MEQLTIFPKEVSRSPMQVKRKIIRQVAVLPPKRCDGTGFAVLELDCGHHTQVRVCDVKKHERVMCQACRKERNRLRREGKLDKTKPTPDNKHVSLRALAMVVGPLLKRIETLEQQVRSLTSATAAPPPLPPGRLVSVGKVVK